LRPVREGGLGWETEKASGSAARVPDLVLGPLLRYAGPSEATVWVETDAPCEVTVSAGDGKTNVRSSTFGVGGHHYALLRVSGLEPGEAYEYEVELDGPAATITFEGTVLDGTGEPGLRTLYSHRLA